LLDEPMSSLDTHLRQQMRELVVKLHRASGIATLMVTHDPAEALAASDTIVVMNLGRVVELGDPQKLYHSPKTVFTARLLGPANIVEGPMVGLPGGTRALIRPGAIELNPATSAFTRRVVVESVEFQGNYWAATLADAGFRWLAHGPVFPPPGTEVTIGAARVHPLAGEESP
jgi:ABC-type Fe3+/spermidine/putrescine transport system ATPase subunit